MENTKMKKFENSDASRIAVADGAFSVIDAFDDIPPDGFYEEASEFVAKGGCFIIKGDFREAVARQIEENCWPEGVELGYVETVFDLPEIGDTDVIMVFPLKEKKVDIFAALDAIQAATATKH